ncbi:MAG: hypothetical protein AAGA71_10850 [Pseudomonadota bacterium]
MLDASDTADQDEPGFVALAVAWALAFGWMVALGCFYLWLSSLIGDVWAALCVAILIAGSTEALASRLAALTQWIDRIISDRRT